MKLIAFTGSKALKLAFFVMPFLFCGLSRGATVQWKPVTAEERSPTSSFGPAGAPAVCLFSEVFTDDLLGTEHHYVRIKVLTKDGRSQGDLTIPYIKGAWDLKELHVRTTQPDGVIVEDPVMPIDRLIVRYKRFKTQAKTLAIPDVQPGTIIEYQYDRVWDRRFVHSDSWFVDATIFTVRASFARRPTPFFHMHYNALRVPKGEGVTYGPDGILRLELKNVPASEAEDFMPPDAESRPRVNFYYYTGQSVGTDPDTGWPEIAKFAQMGMEKYLSGDRGLDGFLADAVKPGDSPLARLHTLYDRVQAMRNLSFEDEKAKAETKRQNLKPAENVGDVIKHGYGIQEDLDLLFLAAARRAGFEAWLLAVARRDGDAFFTPISLSLDGLPGRAVLVRLDGSDYFLDPGTPLLPFGWLPWGETSVKALKVDMASGKLIDTRGTEARESVIERNAQLKLDENGALEGDVAITYSGFEAFDRLFEARDKDDLARRQMLESEVQQWIPKNAEVI